MNLINFYCFCRFPLRSFVDIERERKTSASHRTEKRRKTFSIIFHFRAAGNFFIHWAGNFSYFSVSARCDLEMFFSFLISGIGQNSHFFRWTNCFRVLSLSLLLIARIYGEHVKLNKHLHTMTQCTTDSCFVPLKIISSPSHPRLRPRAHYVRRLSHIYWQMPKAEWQIWSLGIEGGISYRAHSGNNKEEEKSSKALLNVNAEHVGSSMGFFIQMNFQFFQIDFFGRSFSRGFELWVHFADGWKGSRGMLFSIASHRMQRPFPDRWALLSKSVLSSLFDSDLEANFRKPDIS